MVPSLDMSLIYEGGFATRSCTHLPSQAILSWLRLDNASVWGYQTMLDERDAYLQVYLSNQSRMYIHDNRFIATSYLIGKMTLAGISEDGLSYRVSGGCIENTPRAAAEPYALCSGVE